jgi:hypothetical protein
MATVSNISDARQKRDEAQRAKKSQVKPPQKTEYFLKLQGGDISMVSQVNYGSAWFTFHQTDPRGEEMRGSMIATRVHLEALKQEIERVLSNPNLI